LLFSQNKLTKLKWFIGVKFDKTKYSKIYGNQVKIKNTMKIQKVNNYIKLVEDNVTLEETLSPKFYTLEQNEFTKEFFLANFKLKK